MEAHELDFFGKNSAFILNSSAKSEPFIMLKFIKRKDNATWERLNEGKTVKLNLREMVYILAVLEKKVPYFSTFHRFKDETTKISFRWDDIDVNMLWINVAEYSRSLLFPETDLLEKLMRHLVDEKIEFATASNYNATSPNSAEEEVVEFEQATQEPKRPIHPPPITAPYQQAQQQSQYRQRNQTATPQIQSGNRQSGGNYIKQNQPVNQFSSQTLNSTDQNTRYNTRQPSQYNSNTTSNNTEKRTSGSTGAKVEVKGTIKIARPKALLLNLNEYGELWIPKSAITSNFDENSKIEQQFLMFDWCINKPSVNSVST